VNCGYVSSLVKCLAIFITYITSYLCLPLNITKILSKFVLLSFTTKYDQIITSIFIITFISRFTILKYQNNIQIYELQFTTKYDPIITSHFFDPNRYNTEKYQLQLMKKPLPQKKNQKPLLS
jgi:hypothetical protein